MPRLLFEFSCINEHITDHFIDTKTMVVDCPTCGESAQRMVSPPTFLIRQGVDPDMPTAAAKWAKMQREKNSGRMTDTNNDRHGGMRPQDE